MRILGEDAFAERTPDEDYGRRLYSLAVEINGDVISRTEGFSKATATKYISDKFWTIALFLEALQQSKTYTEIELTCLLHLTIYLVSTVSTKALGMPFILKNFTLIRDAWDDFIQDLNETFGFHIQFPSDLSDNLLTHITLIFPRRDLRLLEEVT